MIISFIYYVALFKFVDSSFPQCNVHTGSQGGCLAFTPLDGYIKLGEFHRPEKNKNKGKQRQKNLIKLLIFEKNCLFKKKSCFTDFHSFFYE